MGIAHLQFQISTMAKTRQKCRRNNKLHNVTEVMQRRKQRDLKYGQATDTINEEKQKKKQKANAYNSKIILTFFSHCVIIF
jgi:type II secretory pathway component HofQ